MGRLSKKWFILPILILVAILVPPLPSDAQTNGGIEASGKIIIGGERSSSEDKDFWDKASVISQFVASVVIVLVGAFITARIQRTQITTNKESADAQVKASKETAEAQIEASNIRARAERRIQEGDLVRQFLEHLKSASDVERELAIVALHGSIPDKKYFDVVTVIARNDPKESVRSAAINMLKASDASSVRQTLGQIVNDQSRGEAERRLAKASAVESSLATDIPTGTILMTASGATEHAYEIAELGGRLFTHSFVESLTDPELLAQGGGQIESRDLFRSVQKRMNEYSLAQSGQFVPSPTMAAQEVSGSIPLAGENLPYANVIAVAIGIGEYISDGDFAPLKYAESDAKKILAALNATLNVPIEESLLVGLEATSEVVAEAILQAVHGADANSMIVLYFVGNSFIDNNGDVKFACADGDYRTGTGTLSMQKVNQILQTAKSAVRFVILDTSYSGAAASQVLR